MPRALVALILLCLGTDAFARDDGRYAQSPNKQWFDSLKNKVGQGCCSDLDGIKLEDPEWECKDDVTCVVKLDGDWIDVPRDALLTENNRVGYAIVWRVVLQNGKPLIRCFIRGSQT